MSIIPDDPALAGRIATGDVVAYFGYGSLVNAATLRTDVLAMRRASVVGWRRRWVPRDADTAMALLSVAVDPGDARLDGVVVYDRAENLPAVDAREAGYARRVVPAERLFVDAPAVPDLPVFIYEADAGAFDATHTGAAILQSYLDTVMQGQLRVHGEAALRRFVSDTHGFETRLLRDRAAPRYPRPVMLETGEAALFDALVAERGVEFVDP